MLDAVRGSQPAGYNAPRMDLSPLLDSLNEAQREAVTAPLGPVASLVISSGTVTSGGVVSSTVMVNDAVALLPASSVAEQLIGVSPSGKVSPDS